MENTDKGLNVPILLINRTKATQMPQNLSAQIVCLSPKVWDFDEKKASLGVRSPWVKVLCVWIRFLLILMAKMPHNHDFWKKKSDHSAIVQFPILVSGR